MSRFDELVWSAALNGAAPSLPSLVAGSAGRPSECVVFETVIVAEEVEPLDLLSGGHTVNVGQRSVMLVSDRDGDFVLVAEPAGAEGVFHIVGSTPSSDARWQRIERRIRSSAPNLVPCFLNHNDFADIGSALSEFGTVEVRTLSARHRRDPKSINLSWKRDEYQLRPDHRAAIEEAEEQEASLRSLRLYLAESEGLDLHVRRVSGATFYSGNFEVFNSVVLPRLANAADRRRRLMHDRQRRAGAPVPEPIEVVLPIDRFKGADDTAKILDHIAKVSHLSHAVLHRNPYFHLSVTDHHDGSNFDVMVTSADRIQITPGFRASPGAFTELAQYLGDWFAADRISEAATEQAFSIYDLISR
ncbi:hypothetical protein IEQ44_07950 [Nocardioides sp. Y6]|uniref:Uncharacterized protein n=1 Tax=Nocardioides malaquae TaxID=2773426 RepID=A0ABR9RSN8_9ACTN|nr:hypothetical protein [Nocardioides malaquae]MBE7324582.1 hypothetical protein [Nocardioides malaquae]